MAEVDEAAAIASAREQLRLASDVPAQAWPVRRIDRPGESYWFVVFGARDAALGAAAVDAQSGAVMVSAALPGTQAQLAVDAAQALQIAGQPPGTAIALAWQASAASRSPLYPLWAIAVGNETLYVDQHGRIWRTLSGGERGG
ncbi:MAG: hypothetical protein ABI537_05190 [Casimicrobiaceae bacterium]